MEKSKFGVCPLFTFEKIISGKWMLPVLRRLEQNDGIRFGALLRCFPEITLAASFMIWRKGITRRYLRGNQAQLENVCQQLSAMPIRYLGTTLPRKFREQALQIGPLYFVPEKNAPADCAARAAEITEPLFAALMESEKKRFSDYSQPPEVKLCFRKLGESVWRVKVSTAWLNGRASLYYSPLGRTRALKERAWWPPIALSPVWFV